MKNRSEIEIMASILRCATTNWEYKTTIMNNASVSHSQLIRYLAIAEDRGLVEYSKITGLYKTTEAGLRVLTTILCCYIDYCNEGANQSISFIHKRHSKQTDI